MAASACSHNRTIIHFDIDCFYAQVEMIRNPTLRGKPLGIQQKYLLVTCNYEARRQGVTKLMSISDAQKKCPNLVIVNGEDLTHYRNMSYQISDYIQKYTQQVERLGFDENYADVSEIVEDRIRKVNFEHKFFGKVFEFEEESTKETETDANDDTAVCSCGCLLRVQIGSQIAADIREGLNHELGITCCAGIAHNKLLAKLVGSIHKPNQQTSILPHLGCQMVSSLPGLRSIPGIGSSSAKRLKAKGIDSIWDLQQAPLPLLEEEFGKNMAETFSKLCLGIDDSPVVPFTLPQTISDEDSFKCCNNLEDAKSRIHQLIASLLKRLLDDARIPSTLRLTVRGKDYIRNCRQCPIPASVFKGFGQKAENLEMTSSWLMPLLLNLFHKLVDTSQPFHLTLINVCFAKLLEPTSRQNTLDSFFKSRSSKTNLSKSKPNHSCSRSECVVKNTIDAEEFDDDDDDEDAIEFDKPYDVRSNDGNNGKYFDKNDEFQNSALNCFNQSINTIQNKEESIDIGNDTHSLGSCFSVTNQVTSASKQLSNSHGNSSFTPENATVILSGEERGTVELTVKPELYSETESTASQFHHAVNNINNDQSIENLKKILPKHIDASEVLTLPDDIQNEVLTSYGITSKTSNDGHKTYSLVNKVSTRSQRQSVNCSNVESRQNSNQGSELCHHCHAQRKPLFSPRKRKSENESEVFDGSVSNAETVLAKMSDTSDIVNNKKQKCNDDDIYVENGVSENWKMCVEKEKGRNLAMTVCDRNEDSSPTLSISISSSMKDSHAAKLNTNYVTPFSKGLNEKVEKGFELISDANPLHSPCSKERSINSDEQEGFEYRLTLTTPSASTSTSTKKNVKIPDCVGDASFNTSSVSFTTKNKKEATNKLSSSQSQDNLYTSPQKTTSTGQQISPDKSLATSTSMSANKQTNTNTNTNTISNPTHSKGKKCPVGIDPDVFYSLPPNIQGEILAHNAMGTGSLFTSGDHHPKTSNDDSDSIATSSNRSCVPGNSNSNRKGVRAQRDIFDYFKKK